MEEWDLWDKEKGERGKRVELFYSVKGSKKFRNLSRIRYNCDTFELVIFSVSFLFKADLPREIATSKGWGTIIKARNSRNSTPSFNMDDNDGDEKYRELFYLFRSCWAIYKFILCDTIGKIYTVCLIKCIRIEKICCETEERYLAKRERLFQDSSKLSLFRQFLLFSPSLILHGKNVS